MLTERPWRDPIQESEYNYRALDVDSPDWVVERTVERQRSEFYLAWLEYIEDYE